MARKAGGGRAKRDRSLEGLYRYLETCRRREGRFPTYRQIARALGWKSTNTVAYHVNRLVEVGLLEKAPGEVRSFALKRYRRSRYLRRQVTELEVRPTRGLAPSPARTMWIDNGWFAGGSMKVYELSGRGPFLEEFRSGDLLVVDEAAEPDLGDIVAVSLGDEILVGRLYFEGASRRLLVSEEPEEVLFFGAGALAGEISGQVVGLLRRFRTGA